MQWNNFVLRPNRIRVRCDGTRSVIRETVLMNCIYLRPMRTETNELMKVYPNQKPTDRYDLN